VIVYDLIASDAFPYLRQVVEWNRPDFVVLIGAHEKYHDRPIPRVEHLAEVGKTFPLVHFCCDGAEPVWWEQVQRYYEQGRFALQINIDGVRTGPVGERGLTLLTPFDPGLYPDPPVPWEARSVLLAFPGSPGDPSHPRGRLIHEFIKAGVLSFRPRDHNHNGDPDDAAYRAYLQSCKGIMNFPWTGSSSRMHVKGRVIEAGLAGSVLFEYAGSPTEDWFNPGVDYVAYSSLEEVAQAIAWMTNEPRKAQKMATSLRKKVLEDHSPEIFWGHVIERLGLGNTSHVLKQPKFRPWQAITVPPPPMPAPSVVPQKEDPKLIGSRNKFNIVKYDRGFYVVPQRLGPLDLRRDDHRRRQGVRRCSSLEEAQVEIGA
jgi:hypothetical protein